VSETETSQPRIEQALTIVQREIDCIEAELTAFRRFRTSLASIEPTVQSVGTAEMSAGGMLASGAQQQKPDTNLRAIREAYRETVMAVSHFEAEYDDSLEANMTMEFGPDLGTQISTGTRLTPQLYEALLTASESARNDRQTMLPALERERESLQSVQKTLDDCERHGAALGTNARQTTDPDRLDSIDDRLAEIEADCEAAAATRQQRLHSRSASALSGIDETSLVRYLYGDCSVTCPALTDIVACLGTIKGHRRHCLVSTC
jgi:prefoldin subunit 5